ncbi:RNA polymerase sigma factor [Labilibacter marinus]|uniref:RNA polymerase sigma factor n=1 Tax=Labilibacter marinus TaxID=1477105 RepID=UPI00094FE735|nr:RNA polymerase sigma factor [Labilibacter marinus]
MNDIELINQVKKGNHEAYRFLVSQHERLVFSIAQKMTSHHQMDTEDIAQEVFIKVYKNIKSYRKESKLSTWIASIAWKTSIDYVRKKTRNKIDLSEEPEIFESDFSNLTYKSIRENEIKSIVAETIARLPGHYQTVLSLYYLEEFSNKEIQEITRMPLGTIKSYLSRARNIFKTELEKHHGNNVIELLYNDK